MTGGGGRGREGEAPSPYSKASVLPSSTVGQLDVWKPEIFTPPFPFFKHETQFLDSCAGNVLRDASSNKRPSKGPGEPTKRLADRERWLLHGAIGIIDQCHRSQAAAANPAQPSITSHTALGFMCQ